jgi:hypothetical protein
MRTEREVIFRYCADRAQHAGLALTSSEETALADYLRSYQPTQMQLVPALERLKEDKKEDIAALVDAAIPSSANCPNSNPIVRTARRRERKESGQRPCRFPFRSLSCHRGRRAFRAGVRGVMRARQSGPRALHREISGKAGA